MTAADDKQNMNNAKIVGAGLVGVAAGVVAAGAVAMAIDPALKGKFEKKVEEGKDAVTDKIEEVKGQVEEGRDNLEKKVDKAKADVADKLK